MQNKQLTTGVFFFGAALTVLLLSYCSWQLHIYYSNFSKVKFFFESLENPAGNNSLMRFHKNLVYGINLQLAEDSSTDIFRIAGEINDSDYNRKLVSEIYHKMRSMLIQVVDINSNGDQTCCKLLVGDKNPYEVSFYFFEKGDTLILTNIKNLGPLFKSIKCAQKFKSENNSE